MVQDIRRITLSGEELTAALIAYQRITPDFAPGGKIVDSRPMSDSSVTVTMETVETLNEKSPRRVEVSLKSADVLKPLIRFCLENNIMLPRNGQKSVAVADGKAALYVVLNLDIDLGSSLDPMRSSHLGKLTPADLLPQTVRLNSR